MKPIFLLSLPRSGSTLLQRKLMQHQLIATVDEPWILLPLLAAKQRDVAAGVYSHDVLVRALEDFTSHLKGGEADWDAQVRNFAEGLYDKVASHGEEYFLDKTPRYSLFAKDLVRTFPDAKYILLWRDPLSIVQSINDTFFAGKWSVPYHAVDLYDGLEGMLEAKKQLGSHAFELKYEDFIHAPDENLKALFEWLGLDLQQLRSVTPKLEGRMGDPKRRDDDGLVRRRSSDWRVTPVTFLRKRWMRRYINWIGSDRLVKMGYDPVKLYIDISMVPVTWRGIFSDSTRFIGAPFWVFFNFPLLKKRTRRLLKEERNFVFW